MHGHGHQRADQDGGKELTDQRLGDGERAGDRRHRGDFTADGCQSAKTEVRQLRDELIKIPWRRDEMKGPRLKLFDHLEGGSPGHSEEQIRADAALDAAPADRSRPEHDHQHNANVEKQRDRGKDAAELMHDRRGSKTTHDQENRSRQKERDYQKCAEATLLYGKRSINPLMRR